MLKQTGQTRLLAGCAGFAAVLAHIIDFEKNEPQTIEYGKNMLIVSGSINAVSTEQLKMAKKRGITGFVLTPEQKLGFGYADSPACGRFVDDIMHKLSAGGAAYIAAAENDNDIDACNRRAASYNMDAEQIRAAVADNIGAIVKKTAETGAMDNLFVFGGDTLSGIVKQLNITRLYPAAEICPGAVVSITPAYPFNIITKSGGLGPPDVCLLAADKLNREG